MGLRNRLNRLQSQSKRFFRRESLLWQIIWLLLFTAVLTAVFTISLTPEQVSLAAGQVAPRDVYATRQVIDRWETDRLRKEEADEIKDVYEQDPAVAEAVDRELDGLFREVRRVRASEDMDAQAKLAALREVKCFSELQDEALTPLLEVEAEALAEAEARLSDMLSQVMEAGIKRDALVGFQQQAVAAVRTLRVDEQLLPALEAVAQDLVRPNMVVNRKETLRRKSEAAARIEPVVIVPGELVLQKGEKATERHIGLLSELGLLKTGANWRVLAGSLLFALVVTATIGFYVQEIDMQRLKRHSILAMIFLVTAAVVLLGSVLKLVSFFLLPVAAGAMLLTVLVNLNLGLLMSLILGLAVLPLTGFDVPAMFTLLVGAVAGVFSVQRVGQRSDLVRTAAVVAAGSLIARLAIDLCQHGSGMSASAPWHDYLWALLGGGLSAVLMIGTLPFFENYFGVITAVKLLELANPNQPLMRRLLLEAPGTYHHSAIVANLAEAAVEAVGGNSLLARVCAYYHDVGKLKRPYFFIENQLSGDNPHDKISPTLSVLILTSHVRDGVELAREARLPQPVIDCIREHHGTTLVSYFYSRASETGKDEQILEEDFRYDGPQPRARETAIVMLADSAEAAVRSLQRPTPSRIEQVVRRVIRERLDDKQFDNCDLTFQDLTTIGDTLARMLTGVFHPRVEYPDAMLREAQKREGRQGGAAADSRGRNGNGDGRGGAGTAADRQESDRRAAAEEGE